MKADYLRYILQESLTMEADSIKARASFMPRAGDVRDHLYFAPPEQRIQGIMLYCCDAYGNMLWEHKAKYSESFFKA